MESADDKTFFKKHCKGFLYTPPIINERVSRIIAIGDIHGNLQLAKDCLKIAKCIELTYCFLDDINIIYDFIEIFKNDKYDFMIILNIMQNKEIIRLLKPHKGHKTFYHLYNYLTNIHPDNIGLNIV